MRRLVLCGVLGLLGGCGAGEPPPPQEHQKTVFDPMTQQLDKVQQKAATLPDERKGNLDKAIESDN